MDELNPNHPVTQEAHDHWHKICFLLMRKMGVTEIAISPEEIKRAMGADDQRAVTIRIDDIRGIQLFIVSEQEAQRLVRKEGGLPV